MAIKEINIDDKYDNINIYPQDIQSIIKVLLEHEKQFTVGYTYNDNEVGDKEVIEFLTTVAYELLTEVKKAVENQIPMWRFENGQFVANQTSHS
jgi:hypothetical protein